MYTVYNRTKKERLEPEFKIEDVWLSGSPLSQHLRILLSNEWNGDEVAIIREDIFKTYPEYFYSDPWLAKKYHYEGAPIGTRLPIFAYTEDELVCYNEGCLVGLSDKPTGIEIYRIDTLIPLLTVDIPEKLKDFEQPDLAGSWAFTPITVTNEMPPEGLKDISSDYDPEDFYATFDDDEIMNAILMNNEQIPESGYDESDIIGMMVEYKETH